MDHQQRSHDSCSRANFSRRPLAAGTALALLNVRGRRRPPPARKGPNERLNLAVVGLGGQGLYDLHEASTLNGAVTENIVAICDVDAAHLGRAVAKYQYLGKAQQFSDFRRVLDLDNLDGVVVATPDFAHAIVVVAALKRGLPVYSEKPLTKTVSELRTLMP